MFAHDSQRQEYDTGTSTVWAGRGWIEGHAGRACLGSWRSSTNNPPTILFVTGTAQEDAQVFTRRPTNDANVISLSRPLKNYLHVTFVGIEKRLKSTLGRNSTCLFWRTLFASKHSHAILMYRWKESARKKPQSGSIQCSKPTKHLASKSSKRFQGRIQVRAMYCQNCTQIPILRLERQHCPFLASFSKQQTFQHFFQSLSSSSKCLQRKLATEARTLPARLTVPNSPRSTRCIHQKMYQKLLMLMQDWGSKELSRTAALKRRT